MKTFFLQKGLVVLYQGEHLEFSARFGDDLYFEEPQSGRRETFAEAFFWEELMAGSIEVVPAFSSTAHLLIKENVQESPKPLVFDVKPQYQEETIRRHKYLMRLINDGVSIGQTKIIAIEVKKIALLVQDCKPCPSVTTIRRWWRALLNSDFDTASLINKNAIKSRSLSTNGESEEFLQEKINDFYLTPMRESVAGAYKGYLAAIFTENEKRVAGNLSPLYRVSVKTFYLRIKSRSQYEVKEARYGREVARREFRMIKGHMPAEYPLDAVEIDHTPMNLYVIDDQSYLPLGRPWLTAIRDRYSGVLLGFYISFQATGLSSIFGAIKHSLFSHRKAMERWGGFENPWPAFGRGYKYVSDRGLDFTSLHYRAAITGLGSTYEHCERRTPWLKGSIERFFLTLEQTFFEAMPGKTFACLQKRGDYDPAQHAVIRFTTLTYLMHKWVVDYQNILPNSRKGASPLDLWNEGIGFAPPPYPSNIDELNIILGHRHEGKLSHEGIRFKRLNYTDDELHDLMKQVGSGFKLKYVVSPEDISFIHVKDPRNSRYIKAYCTRPEYASGLTLFQHSYLCAESKIALKNGDGVDSLVRARQQLISMINDECYRKENHTKAKLARLAGINSNSAIDGINQTLAVSIPETLLVATPSLDSTCEVVPEAIEPPVTNIRPYTWGV